MRKLFISAVVSATLVGGAASAADLPLKAPPMPVAVYNWTGCYVGVNGGWKGGRFRNESVDAPAGVGIVPGTPGVPFAADRINLAGLDADSGAVGGQIGCRWETASHWVFGVEGDADWTNLHGTVTNRANGPGATFVIGDTFDNRVRWESSVRGIIGRSFDKWLVYATGGLAVTDISMASNYIATISNRIPFPASGQSDSQTLYGFTIGAGAAYAFAPNWDVGAEYRYSEYNGGNFNLGPIAAFCTLTVCTNVSTTGHKDLTTNEVLVKLNYRFSPMGGAVVAKY
jgi:outer membrane immunogenic protein